METFSIPRRADEALLPETLGSDFHHLRTRLAELSDLLSTLRACGADGHSPADNITALLHMALADLAKATTALHQAEATLIRANRLHANSRRSRAARPYAIS